MLGWLPTPQLGARQSRGGAPPQDLIRSQYPRPAAEALRPWSAGRAMRAHARAWLTCAGTAIALSACGAGAPVPTSPTLVVSQHDKDEALVFAQCMRAHGVPADNPTFAGGGITFTYPQSVNLHSAAFDTAHATCMSSIALSTP